MERKFGKSICFFSGKGGVGKTTTILNLAGVYSVLNIKVLLLDFDLTNGEIALALNKTFQKTVYHYSLDVMNHGTKELKDYVTPYNEFIDFLPAPKDPRQGSKVTIQALDLLLQKAKMEYDVVLVDLSHVITSYNLFLLDTCDEIFFILNNSPYDVKNMKSLLAIFKQLNKTNYKIILNESLTPFSKYFSLFDIKSLLHTNIDYLLTSDFFIENMDHYVMNGELVTLQPKVASIFNKDFTTLTRIATDSLEKKGDE